MSKIKISIIIPVYNTQAFLKQCLDSVVAQNFDDMEVILVDDCSPDDSRRIIDQFINNDSRFICLAHDVNKGLPEARNSGVEMARGKYIIHLDSDDYWLDNNMLLRLYQVAEIDNCDVLRFNGLHHINGECSQPIIRPENIVNGSFESNHQFWNYRSVFLYFFRKSFIDKFDLKFLPGLSLGEDAIFLSNALPKAKKISSIPDFFYAYRFDNESLMRKPWSLENFKQEESAARLISNNIKHVKGAFIKYWSFRLGHYWSTKLMVRSFNELDDEDVKKLIEFVSETVAEIDTVELTDDKNCSVRGREVIKFLLQADTEALKRYICKINALPHYKPRFYFIRKMILNIRPKLEPLLIKCYWTFIRIIGWFFGKIAIRKRLAELSLKEKEFNNVEGFDDYNFTLSKKIKPLGVSVMLRVKNEEKFISACLDSIVEIFDEIVVIDNGSTDSTKQLVTDFKKQHPLGKRVSLHSYPFSIAKCGSDHQRTNESSVKSLAYYYNWCLSRCQYSMICKWDADMLLSENMQNRTLFKRFILRLVNAKRRHTGSIPVQTVYIDKMGKNYISQNETHEEVRFFPSTPAIYFVKDKLWEVLKITLAINNMRFETRAVFELKDVKQDEFSHWSSDTFVGERKAKEYRNYMYIQNDMHLDYPNNFLESDSL